MMDGDDEGDDVLYVVRVATTTMECKKGDRGGEGRGSAGGSGGFQQRVGGRKDAKKISLVVAQHLSTLVDRCSPINRHDDKAGFESHPILLPAIVVVFFPSRHDGRGQEG